MNKKEFLNKLYISLRNITEAEKREIMEDYEEHFNVGIERGLSEEEISKKLGNPEHIGRQYKYNSLVNKAEENTTPLNIMRVLISGIGLGFFNLVLGLPIVATIVALLISGLAVGLSMGIAGVSISIASLLEPLNLPFINMVYIPNMASRFMLFFLGIGVFLLSIASTIGVFKLTQVFFKGILKYIKANAKIITG
ncbi:hypothetical protein DUF1700 [Gottschalkia acidurici 9a]|uniref:DUF1700 domain-containing protein n=1 Tax=Gottschalkia acidurici (strain ATCC 7906 / DSM 604 / BCRC 14475 / CIP 104303 / KCTC 5404 / NCIMB 10678 / 9a) TaxID=1128398 RepID=K0AYB9_GOTA9|nr:DUF1700 domain-containing protein [Gottschalkia acidurici]AFS77767.1 hypothetical protein DUF1700 [Gottschalkia acidurici 9a]